jgi:hypothetical protein
MKVAKSILSYLCSREAPTGQRILKDDLADHIGGLAKHP